MFGLWAWRKIQICMQVVHTVRPLNVLPALDGPSVALPFSGTRLRLRLRV